MRKSQADGSRPPVTTGPSLDTKDANQNKMSNYTDGEQLLLKIGLPLRI